MGVGGEVYLACDGEETLEGYDGNRCRLTSVDIDVGLHETAASAAEAAETHASEDGWTQDKSSSGEPRHFCGPCSALKKRTGQNADDTAAPGSGSVPGQDVALRELGSRGGE